MLTVKIFVFSPYQENTFVISDEDKNCAIIDPGCYEREEKEQLDQYIESNGLKVELLLNTHGHLDHMFGNKHIVDKYKIPFVTHEKVIAELASVPMYAGSMGFNVDPSPNPDRLVEEGDTIKVGNHILEVLFTPGHSAGHISFFCKESNQLFSGDVLFFGGIGRVDLPGGSYPVLMNNIVEKLLPLGDDVTVYCGHGPMTTIGQERRSNGYILDYLSKNKA